jgi:hypothetical protein
MYLIGKRKEARTSLTFGYDDSYVVTINLCKIAGLYGHNTFYPSCRI